MLRANAHLTQVLSTTNDVVVDAVSFGVVINGESVATYTKAKQATLVTGLQNAVPGEHKLPCRPAALFIQAALARSSGTAASCRHGIDP